ncbi:MAG TPA: glycosyltransferase [Candidatus Dormibacteraeota bacterium]|jgi:dolichol-phosphate mannosyltransferase|nr:glycosyltransferase [Candidatus Dormibacteraeota bacterium]
MPKEPLLTVVVPTRNEAGNVEPLLERLGGVLRGLPFEVVFVDDSTDTTPEVLAALAAAPRRDVWVRAIHRPPERRTGLGSAVVEGLREARGAVVAVMDADLQHPPEVLRPLLAAIQERDLDVAVASRYMAGGSAAGLSGPARRLVSRGSKLLAQMLFREARKTSDPLSGYFLARRDAIEGTVFRPIGFKILLEVLVCVPEARVGDVPLAFEARHAGVSNASMAQGIAYLRHVRSLFVQVPGSARIWKYGLVGGVGLALYLALLALGRALGFGPFLSWAVAFGLSLALNWQLNRLFTFRDVASPFSPGRSRPVYLPVALLGGLPNLIVFTLLLDRLGVIGAGVCGAAAAMLLNYAVHRRLLRRPPLRPAESPEAEQALVARIAKLVDGRVSLVPAEADEGNLAEHLGGQVDPPLELLRASDRRQPLLVARAPSTALQARHDVGLSAWMGVPVLEGRRFVGTLVVHRQGAPYGVEELETVMAALRSTARRDASDLSALLLNPSELG